MDKTADGRIRVGITMGDPAGVGPEIILKALADEDIYEQCIPVVIGDRAALEDALRFCRLPLTLREVSSPAEACGEPKMVDYIDMRCLQAGGWRYKKPQKVCGEASFQYVLRAIELACRHEIGAVITAPISKEALHLAGHMYSGHTEIFAEYTGTSRYAMLLAAGNLRVIHVSTHVSLRDACDLVKKERVLETIRLANEGLQLLGVTEPSIAVAGLNPHSSENGLFGREEQTEIIPAVDAARGMGIHVTGPEPPDTVFVRCLGGQYDAVVAMYHDQGHIPLKLAGFRLDPKTNAYVSMRGINYTVGLPIVRVSVDHGTAYGKAGEGRANPESMTEAIMTGVLIAKNKERKKPRDPDK